MSTLARLLYPLVFATTLFLSSALLFLLQPLVGRMLVIRLGGTPAVWNATLLFFQATVLAAYLYVFVLHLRRGIWPQAALHVALLGVALALLIMGNQAVPAPEWDAEAHPIWQTLLTLISLFGLPVLVVAATPVLVQRWFAATTHPDSGDPYFLYAASSLGGLLALSLYPAWIDALLPLNVQFFFWFWGVVLMGLLMGGCLMLALLAVRRYPLPPVVEPPSQPLIPSAASVPVPATWPRRLKWLACSALPVTLLMGFTADLTEDVAPVPLLWVAPLALYLLSYVLGFARFAVWARMPLLMKILLQAVLGFTLLVLLGLAGVLGESQSRLALVLLGFFLGFFLIVPYTWVWILQPLYAVLFFVSLGSGSMDRLGLFRVMSQALAFYLTARICHRELARARPEASKLPEFYLWIGLGGLLGGAFQLFVAPVLFFWGYVEYPLAAAFACALRPPYVRNGLVDWLISLLIESTQGRRVRQRPRHRDILAVVCDFAVPVFIGLVLWAIFHFGQEMVIRQRFEPTLHLAIYAAAALVCLVAVGRPLRFALCLVLLVVFHEAIMQSERAAAVFVQRTPYGIVKVREQANFPPAGAPVGANRFTRSLMHGTTHHGEQFIQPAQLKRHAGTYYHPQGPLGRVLDKFNWFRGPVDTYHADSRIVCSLVGLGAGTGLVPLPVDQLLVPWSEPPIAALGLGPGTIASYARPFQHIDFFELDPAVIALSETKPGKPPLFTFVEDARQRGAWVRLIPGDGRYALSKQGPDGYYGVIVVDAINSDAMPTHLLTREALQLYMQKLSPNGILCIHTSNRFVDLPPMLATTAEQLALGWVVGRDMDHAAAQADLGRFTSEWFMIARDQLRLDGLPVPERGGGQFGGGPFGGRFWDRPALGAPVFWTDNHAPLWTVLRPGHSTAGVTLLRVMVLTMVGLVVVVSIAGMVLGLLENVQAPVADLRRERATFVTLEETPPPQPSPLAGRREAPPPTSFEAHE